MRALNVSNVDIVQGRDRLNSGEAHLLRVASSRTIFALRIKLERLKAEFPIELETHEYANAKCRNANGDLGKTDPKTDLRAFYYRNT